MRMLYTLATQAQLIKIVKTDRQVKRRGGNTAHGMRSSIRAINTSAASVVRMEIMAKAAPLPMLSRRCLQPKAAVPVAETADKLHSVLYPMKV